MFAIEADHFHVRRPNALNDRILKAAAAILLFEKRSGFLTFDRFDRGIS